MEDRGIYKCLKNDIIEKQFNVTIPGTVQVIVYTNITLYQIARCRGNRQRIWHTYINVVAIT